MADSPKQKSIQPSNHSSLFGPPQLLDGESLVSYNELAAQIRAAVKPLDIIEEMFVDDIVSSAWDVMRWRRIKWSLVRQRTSERLQAFLARALEFDEYRHQFEQLIAEALQKHLAPDQVQDLARQCVLFDEDAVEKVDKLLVREERQLEHMDHDAKVQCSKQLAHDYAQRKPRAVDLVDKILASNGLTMEDLVADALVARGDTFLTGVERFDRLMTIAQERRDDVLREIELRREAFGRALRRSVQDIEGGELKVIEATPANRKGAA